MRMAVVNWRWLTTAALVCATSCFVPAIASAQPCSTSPGYNNGYGAIGNSSICSVTGTVGTNFTQTVSEPSDVTGTFTNNGTITNGTEGIATVNVLGSGVQIGTNNQTTYNTYPWLFAPSLTATNNGTIHSTGNAGSGIFAVSTGAQGVADQIVGDTSSAPNNHYMGRNANAVSVTNAGILQIDSGKSGFSLGVGGVPLPLNTGIDARSVGGAGIADATGNRSNGPGGDAGSVTVATTDASRIILNGSYTAGVYALSAGGAGPGYSSGTHHNFDSGGDGGPVSVIAAGSITGAATGDVGVFAISAGGSSGATDSQYSLRGGNASPVAVHLTGNAAIGVTGDSSMGIFAISAGGLSWYADNGVSNGHQNGNGSTTTVTLDAGTSITTNGELGIGIAAAGTGGNANTSEAPPDSGENGGSPNAVPTTRAPAGNAGVVVVDNSGNIATSGNVAIGIAAVSATGGRAVGLMNGGAIDQVGPGSGSPGTVTVTNSGSIATTGAAAPAILALSVGGSGGVTDTRPGLLNLLGGTSSGSGTNGAAVVVSNSGSLKAAGVLSMGVIAESVGGGGGTATGTGGIVAIGSNGGNGGNGGSVTVTQQNGIIATSGDGAIGILAHSIGGGGGNGGSATGIAAALGGSGGQGGNGGNVSLNLSGAIATSGDFAAGVLAQSVGGGGGNGGYSKNYSPLPVSAAIGGMGGGASYGAEIDLTNNAAITTAGDQSPGIMAHSIGGGGGNGGSANTYQVDFSFTSAVDVGGSAGAGGAGGTVNITNGYHIYTSGADSTGILAQSIGGGGGNGGAAVAKSLAIADDPEIPTISFDVAIGGQGAAGSNGGSVTIGNVGQIGTAGAGAIGILAQSIGGGGGSGGDSTASAHAIEGEGLTFKASVALGGNGGQSGNGGPVSVTSSSCDGCVAWIATAGNHAAGILAQSIGGGGGNGGAGDAETGSPTLGANTGSSLGISFAIGGKAGATGTGGTVNVINDTASSITTAGSGSQGILAQSIGGGGGNGGGGSGGGTGDTIDLNVSIGHDAGAGSDGGSVTVTNNGSIATGRNTTLSTGIVFTTGGDATGILAQSIGGGGGVGGSSDPAATIGKLSQYEDAASTLLATPPSNSYVGQLALGGSGGSGGNGGSVKVSNTGTIVTLGERAYGVLAQSIGGGGGNGGTASADAGGVLGGLGYKLNDAGNVETNRGTYSASLALGRSGGSGGDGGTASVANTGAIGTAGYASDAILVQSIGGGGGVGGEGSTSSTTTIGLGAGWSGGGGSAGAGAGVSVTNTGQLATVGDDAYGIAAQSIGGGGGLAGAGCSNSAALSNQGLTATRCLSNGNVGIGGSVAPWNDASDFSLQAGGGAGSSGNGGSVAVQVDGGSIVTTGARAFGIVAQSIGGGGGLSAATAVNISGTSVQPRPGQNYAKGGNVSVSLGASASITTYGAGAWGILAQSIGGGGGFVGDASLALQFPQSNTLPDKPNSSNDYPDSGTVTVSVAGNITTAGANAHGIFAQAVGGGGGIASGCCNSAAANVVAGNSGQLYGLTGETYAGEGYGVTVTQTAGTIRASGPGSIGIIAQSTGKQDYTQPIVVTIGGSVVGGTNAGATGGTGAAGILLSGGVRAGSNAPASANTIQVNPSGSVSTMDGVAGTAITTDYGVTDVSNSGTITGNILLGSTPGSIVNNAGGTLALGSRVTAASLTNDGTIQVQPGASTVSGNFSQRSAGVLTFDFDGANSHTLAVGGTAALAGSIIPVVGATLHMFTDTILTARGVTELAASAPETLLFGWNLLLDNNTVTIAPVANFQPAGTTLTANQSSVAAYLDRGWTSGSTALAPVFAALYNGARTPAAYAGALDQASARSTQAPAAYLSQVSGAVLGASLSCPQFEDGTSLMGEGSCVWMKVSGEATHDSGADATVSGVSYRLGGQKEVVPGWFLGGSLSSGTIWSDASGGSARSSGQTYDGSVALKHVAGPWMFAGAAAIEGGNFDTSRTISLPGVAGTLTSNPNVLLVGGRLRAAYDFGFSGWYVRPFADLDLYHLHTSGFRESGSSPLGLQVSASDRTNVALSFNVELGGRYDLNPGTILRTYVDVGASMMPNNTTTVDARFLNAPASLGSFRSYVPGPDAFGVLNVGAQLYRVGAWEVRGEYDLRAAPSFTSNGGSVRVAWHF